MMAEVPELTSAGPARWNGAPPAGRPG